MTNFGDQPLSFIVSCAYSNFSMCIKLRECVEWFSYVFMLLCFPYSAAPDLKVAQITPRWETIAEKGGYRHSLQGTAGNIPTSLPQGAAR